MTERKPDYEEARIAQQVKLSLQRDEIRDAILALYRSQQPDDQYDPVDDPRPEQAVKKLVGLTGSLTIAEAIQQAMATIIIEQLQESIKPKPRTDSRVPYEALAKLPPFVPDSDDTLVICPRCLRKVKRINILTYPRLTLCDYCEEDTCEQCKRPMKDCAQSDECGRIVATAEDWLEAEREQEELL